MNDSIMNSSVNYLSAWAESDLIVGIQCSNTLNQNNILCELIIRVKFIGFLFCSNTYTYFGKCTRVNYISRYFRKFNERFCLICSIDNYACRYFFFSFFSENLNVFYIIIHKKLQTLIGTFLYYTVLYTPINRYSLNFSLSVISTVPIKQVSIISLAYLHMGAEISLLKWNFSPHSLADFKLNKFKICIIFTMNKSNLV